MYGSCYGLTHRPGSLNIICRERVHYYKLIGFKTIYGTVYISFSPWCYYTKPDVAEMVLNKCISLPNEKREKSSNPKRGESLDPQEILYSYEFIEDQCEEKISIHLSSLHLRNRREDNENAPEGDERNEEQIELDVVQLHVQENTAVADLEEEKNLSDEEGEDEEQGSDGTTSSSEENDEDDLSLISNDGESETGDEIELRLSPRWGPKKYSKEYHPLALMVGVGLAVCNKSIQ